MSPGASGQEPDRDINDVMSDLDGILQDLTSGTSAPAAQAAIAETRRRAEEARAAAERRAAEEALLKAQREAAARSSAAAAKAVEDEMRRQAEAVAAAKAAEEESRRLLEAAAAAKAAQEEWRRQTEAAAAAKAAEEESRRQAEAAAAAAAAPPPPVTIELAPAQEAEAPLELQVSVEVLPVAVAPVVEISASGPPEVVLNPEPIPDKTPKEQIRRLAFLAANGRREPLDKFAKFLTGVAATVSKRPIFIHKAALIICAPSANASEILEPVQKSGAAGLIILLEGFPAPLIEQLEKVCEANDIFLCKLASEDAAKRTAAIDIVVDLMLIRAG